MRLYFDQDNCWDKWFFEIMTLVGDYSKLIFEMENCQFHRVLLLFSPSGLLWKNMTLGGKAFSISCERDERD